MRRKWFQALGVLTLACLAAAVPALLFRQARALRLEVAQIEAGSKLIEELTGGIELEAVLAQRSADSTWLSHVEAASERAPQLLQKPLLELFVAFDIEVLASTPWESERDLQDKARIIFTRTFELRGEMSALADALHSLEGWPDRLRVTRLSLLPDQEGRVQCKWQLSAVRRGQNEGRST